MSITVLDEKFFAKRADIFTQMGNAITDPTSAKGALEVAGDYSTDIRPLREQINGEWVDAGIRGIYTQGRSGDVRIGVVKGRYVAVQPQEFADLWDQHVKLPVLAVGYAGSNNSTFFLASDLGQINVNGDVLRTYLLGQSPMTGQGAITCSVTPVRLACTNALRAAKQRATVVAQIPHTGQVTKQIGAWMAHLTKDMEAKQKLVEADLKKMDEVEASLSRLNELMAQVYTLPSPPNLIGPSEVVERREREYRVHTNMVNHRRTAFKELFEGRMTGGETLQPTMYRAYQAVVELEQYRRGEASEDARAQSAIFGKRAGVIEEAYRTSLSIATGA